MLKVSVCAHSVARLPWELPLCVCVCDIENLRHAFSNKRAKHKTHLGLIRGDPFAQAIRHNVISANRVAAIPGLILSNYIFYCCNTHPEMGYYFSVSPHPRSPHPPQINTILRARK